LFKTYVKDGRTQLREVTIQTAPAIDNNLAGRVQMWLYAWRV